MKNNFWTRSTALWGVFFTVLTWAGLTLPAQAAEATTTLIQPQKVILTPQSARLQGEVSLVATERNDQTVLLLTLPQGAQEITLDLLPPNTKALRDWRTEPVALPHADGSNAKARAAVLAEIDTVQSRIGILHAQKDVLQRLSANRPNATPAETRQILQDLERHLSALTADLTKQERQLKTLEQRLPHLPETAITATQVVLTLHGVKEETEVNVRYAYTLPQCGWAPVYVFDARSAENTVNMRMLAEVWQNSGMDWSKADITLSTSLDARREPSRLSPWVAQKGRAEARPMAAPGMLRQSLSAKMTMDNAAPAPEAFESTAQSGWTLPKGMTLPEGRTRLPILEETWQAPLQRLARPSVSDSLVWLTARYALQGRSLPNGDATYLLDGSAMGAGNFAPRDGEAVLYFGADPLVTVQTQPDTRLTGKAGIIDKRQTWQWGWTYTLHNQRTQAVTVRLEEPAPQAGDKEITVTLTDKPEATRDKDNVLYWDVQVPAKGTATVRHEVRINAPQNMDVWAGR